MTITLLVGARPNFIKAAPLWRALSQMPQVRLLLVHTGQHWQPEMCDVFFKELGLPTPIRCIPADSTSNRPLSRVALAAALEPLLRALHPDWTVVIGDVTTAAAGALAAYRAGLPLAHVEAGLRCGDQEMAEEQNRIFADRLAQVLFATEPSAVANLLREGIAPERIHLVGNVLIDALLQTLPAASHKPWQQVVHQHAYTEQVLSPENSWANGYVLCTFHRAENVDSPQRLRRLVRLLLDVSQQRLLVFPVHPRTEQKLHQQQLWAALSTCPTVALLRPVPYSDMVCLQKNARAVLTDSGGVQEETTVLGVPCLTLRPSTERPITLQYGANVLLSPEHPAAVVEWLQRFWSAATSPAVRPPLWDGRAAERIARVLTRTMPFTGDSTPETISTLPYRRETPVYSDQ
ncbi:MAG: UDP-N-acetylglucosamine 2-epimerase (non-hydrolyzing) [Saprospiraceae bacterium]|nr:UDP-N-acetylglucosamine 2-epimerase (non-hydrolyzing) [Saprospiraceae bacterium]MDW8230000.1 UDP-N-acetylglucosamine 2-epimerase (non-hydrolyzing) [Saprospiraceae bacterium]